MFTPKAFSIRSAISGDRDVFSFTRSESVARRTPSTSTPELTLRPCGSRISSRMNAPGCGGFIPTFAIVDLPDFIRRGVYGITVHRSTGQGGRAVSAGGDTISRFTPSRRRYDPWPFGSRLAGRSAGPVCRPYQIGRAHV